MKKTIIYIILGLILLSSVFAEEQSLGAFKKNTCIDLIQTCADCSYVNFTSVRYPDSTVAEENLEATKQGTVFNYTYCNTPMVGKYIVNGVGDVGGIDTVFSYSFNINEEGSIGQKNVLITVVAAIVYLMFILSLVFKDKTIAMISAFAMILMGIYLHFNGFNDIRNSLTDVLAIINIGIGTYILIRAGVEWMQEEMGR